MSDNDLIRRGDALKILDWGDIYGRNAQDAINSIPATQPTVSPLRYIEPEGETIDQMRDHARQHPLAQAGDMRLVWVNEGDLHMHTIFHAAQPTVSPDVTEQPDEHKLTGIWPDFFAPSKYEAPDPRWTDPGLPNFRLVWKLAREVGYSIGLHGSMKRDCDLIAAPWTAEAVSADDLIDHLCKGLNAFKLGDGLPAVRPHGRLAWAIQIRDAYKKHMDISVMPLAHSPDVAALVDAAFQEGFLAGTADGWVNNPRIKMEWKRSRARAALARVKGETK